MKKIHVKSLEALDTVLNVTRALFEKNGECEVIVKNIDESITDAQRALYFVWCGIIGVDLDGSKDSQHQTLKEKFLLNIYINDPENHPEYVGVVDNMNIIRLQCPEQFPAMRALVYNGLTIRDATKHNMIEMLNAVENLAIDYDIRLPAPPRSGLM